MFERPELLEQFGGFEWCRRQRRQPKQRLAAVHVQSDVFEGARRRAAVRRRPIIGDRRAREIEREAVEGRDDLHQVRILEFLLVGEPPAERRHLDVRIAVERGERFGNHRRLDQRFVTLDVDDEIAVERERDFRQPVGAGAVLRARHPARAFARVLHHRLVDARIVGRDHHLREARRRRDAVGTHGQSSESLRDRAEAFRGDGSTDSGRGSIATEVRRCCSGSRTGRTFKCNTRAPAKTADMQRRPSGSRLDPEPDRLAGRREKCYASGCRFPGAS